VKSVYVRYLGWIDGNPANLHPLPPVEASQCYVEFMGGGAAVIKKARKSCLILDFFASLSSWRQAGPLILQEFGTHEGPSYDIL
jgi:alkyl sulfatase BDS1-like metallo-beta-lactamase superfamily hydrolase